MMQNTWLLTADQYLKLILNVPGCHTGDMLITGALTHSCIHTLSVFTLYSKPGSGSTDTKNMFTGDCTHVQIVTWTCLCVYVDTHTETTLICFTVLYVSHALLNICIERMQKGQISWDF